jgi:hypothetical protein
MAFAGGGRRGWRTATAKIDFQLGTNCGEAYLIEWAYRKSFLKSSKNYPTNSQSVCIFSENLQTPRNRLDVSTVVAPGTILVRGIALL